MSKRELGRVEVLARVKRRELRVVDAAALMRVSYRQAKRLRKRYREEGAAGLKHRSAGRRSNRGYAEGFRRRVLGLVGEKYGGPVGERFGPTLAAEHLASEDGVELEAESRRGDRRWMLAAGLWSRERRRRRVAAATEGESARSTLARWCRWTGAFTVGWRSAARKGA